MENIVIMARSESEPSEKHSTLLIKARIYVTAFDKAKGKAVGYISGAIYSQFYNYPPFRNLAEMWGARLDEEYRRKGIGKKMYKMFIDEAIKSGAKAVSSGIVESIEGERTWESLRRDYPAIIFRSDTYVRGRTGEESHLPRRWFAGRTYVRGYPRRK